MQEQEIIALYFARDEAALARTQETYGAYCHAIALNLLRSAEDAEECVNDAYLDVWNTIPPQKPHSFRAYIGALCRHRAIDRLKVRRAVKRGEGTEELPFEELEECIGKNDEDVVDKLVLRDLLNRFLASLTPEARVIFMRRYWYACEMSKIARLQGMSESAVRASLHRSREKLREMLAKEGF